MIITTKRIIIEDYPQDQRETVAKLASILNQFMDDVSLLTNKNISFDNLNRSLITIDLAVDANGKPLTVSQINTGLSSYKGKHVVNVQSLTAGVANVTSTPYLDCVSQGGGIVKIIKFYGLVPNNKVRVTIEFIG